MRKLCAFVSVCAAVLLAATAAFPEGAAYHIGICTGTVSQSEDELRGAEEAIRRYGDAASGGVIKHITYPDNFMSEQETTISQITAFADDPMMKAVIVNQGIPGTTEAFRRIRELRPDILLFTGQASEDPIMVGGVSDLVIQADIINRGYLIILAAHKLGCTDFVLVSFPRHMSYEIVARRTRIMEEACRDLGMEFHFETAPDPMSDVGLAGAQQFILEHVPQWTDKYGPNTAFFCTNEGETEPLIRRIAEGDGYFVEADLPSPLNGYPGALGINLADVAGDFPAILKRVEEAVVERGAGGRMGTWAYSHGFTTSIALVEYAADRIEKGIDATSFRRNYKDSDVIGFFKAATPGAEWNGGSYTDASTDMELKNTLMLYQDTYIFGRGYLGMTREAVPEKYLSLK